FLLGAVLLGSLGFQSAVLAMAAVLFAILVGAALFMPAGLPIGRKGVPFRDVFSREPRVNRLSLARVFLFGARDVWFVVGIPIYFYSVLSDGTPEGNREAFLLVGSFMALWVIGYGTVQAVAPRLLVAWTKTESETVAQARVWVGVLALIPLALSGLAMAADGQAGWLTAALVIGLLVFGVVFAINSALHSYLIL